MNQQQIKEHFLQKLKSDTLQRGKTDVTSIAMVIIVETRRLIAQGISRVCIGSALQNLGKEKGWKIIEITGGNILERSKYAAKTSVPQIKSIQK